jgi:hypothetical protein
MEPQMSKPSRVPEVVSIPTNPEKKYYFDNNSVEDLLVKYSWSGCTNVELRDQVMKHAEELIRQIIMAHNLHRIYPGQEDSSFMDLYQTAWVQIERILYKYKARPHCGSCYSSTRPQDSVVYDPPLEEYGILRPEDVARLKLTCPQCHKQPDKLIYRGTSKVFNMWSQVARTVILAYMKKECRDHKNQSAYQSHLDHRSGESPTLARFMEEAGEICKHNVNHQRILQALREIMNTDDRPEVGIIGKLVKQSGLSRAQVASFLRVVRLRSHEFTDSPINERPRPRYHKWVADEAS